MTSATDQQRLAIDGGTPALPGEPPVWPPRDAEIHAALESAWSDGSWGRYHAEHTDRLIAELAIRHAVKFVTLCASGTFAVELALRSLLVQADDEVMLAGYDFPGNFRAIEAIGARPVLVDLAPNSWRIDLDLIPRAVSPRTKVLVASHLHGDLLDMPRVMEIAAEHGLLVVEDACQVPGTVIAGRPAGSWGDVGVLSFGGSKLLTAGRGGAIFTNDAQAHQRAKIFGDRGNEAFPLSQLQAAVLLPQLGRLDQRNAQRRHAVQRLQERLAGLPGLRSTRDLDGNATSQSRSSQPCETAYYKVPWRYFPEELGGLPIERFVAVLRAENVPIDTGFRGFVGRSEGRCRKAGELTHSLRAAEATLLLHHPILLESDERIDALAAAIQKVIRAYSRPTAARDA